MSATQTLTATASASASSSATLSGSATPSRTASFTPSATRSNSMSATATPTPSATTTLTFTVTATTSQTPSLSIPLPEDKWCDFEVLGIDCVPFIAGLAAIFLLLVCSCMCAALWWYCKKQAELDAQTERDQKRTSFTSAAAPQPSVLPPLPPQALAADAISVESPETETGDAAMMDDGDPYDGDSYRAAQAAGRATAAQQRVRERTLAAAAAAQHQHQHQHQQHQAAPPYVPDSVYDVMSGRASAAPGGHFASPAAYDPVLPRGATAAAAAAAPQQPPPAAAARGFGGPGVLPDVLTVSDGAEAAAQLPVGAAGGAAARVPQLGTDVAGAYQISPECVNGEVLWVRAHPTPRWIYSSPDGFWRFTDSRDDFATGRGYVTASVPHGRSQANPALPPHLVPHWYTPAGAPHPLAVVASAAPQRSSSHPRGTPAERQEKQQQQHPPPAAFFPSPPQHHVPSNPLFPSFLASSSPPTLQHPPQAQPQPLPVSGRSRRSDRKEKKKKRSASGRRGRREDRGAPSRRRRRDRGSSTDDGGRRRQRSRRGRRRDDDDDGDDATTQGGRRRRRRSRSVSEVPAPSMLLQAGGMHGAYGGGSTGKHRQFTAPISLSTFSNAGSGDDGDGSSYSGSASDDSCPDVHIGPSVPLTTTPLLSQQLQQQQQRHRRDSMGVVAPGQATPGAGYQRLPPMGGAALL